jgi:uncharacterized protein (DUF983 family)
MSIASGEDEDGLMRRAILRAALGRCPACGKGRLFRAYLKQVDNCPACGESFGGIRADDAAPWLTIIVTGHIFLPLILMVNFDFLPLWLVAGGWSLFFAGLSAVLLPRAKGVMLAILWRTRAPGYSAS